MASVAFHVFNQFRAEGRCKLFEGSGGYGAGEQTRDFVSVDDVVTVNLCFLDHRERVGHLQLRHRARRRPSTTSPRPRSTRRARRRAVALARRSSSQRALIEYMPFPQELVGKYQSFTQADLSARCGPRATRRHS